MVESTNIHLSRKKSSSIASAILRLIAHNKYIVLTTPFQGKGYAPITFNSQA